MTKPELAHGRIRPRNRTAQVESCLTFTVPNSLRIKRGRQSIPAMLTLKTVNTFLCVLMGRFQGKEGVPWDKSSMRRMGNVISLKMFQNVKTGTKESWTTTKMAKLPQLQGPSLNNQLAAAAAPALEAPEGRGATDALLPHNNKDHVQLRTRRNDNLI